VTDFFQAISSLLSASILAASRSADDWENPLLISTTTAFGLILMYRHVNHFWSHTAKRPLGKDYSEAITTSVKMRRSLAALAISWIVSAFAYLWQSYRVSLGEPR